ncbi:hypothetical protein NPX13_g1561 [Xylaria arbuscula]|uniref:DUF8032 domain-containing protein n=1 Tax=Xylaria arbuscula TaxID=114810 RepID=A0A9W8NLV5_9PEZI|nr:hypothetical protein NPX13_g1561 [Xylaria arbuscula]
MQKLLRPQTYPYASSSTGPYRGLLVRKYPCWDAQGPVRETFMNEIVGKIKECLEQCLPESNTFVGFSLFMVGKVPEKTKPYIMIVSDDQARRKAAFQMVKSRNILSKYPGFELGHCAVAAEFKDLKPLGQDATLLTSYLQSIEDDGNVRHIGDEHGIEPELLNLLSAEVCAFGCPSGTRATRLYFHTSPRLHSHDSAFGTCGGLVRIEDELYALTMAHTISPIHPIVTSSKQWETYPELSSESDDFEFTGMDDWDEDDEDADARTLTAITSPGSKTPSELSDSEESMLSVLKRYDSRHSSDTSIQTRITTVPSVIYEDNTIDDFSECEDEPDHECEPFGSVVAVDMEMDIAVIKVDPVRYREDPLWAYPFTLALSGRGIIDDDLSDTSITIRTTHHPEIRGHRSQMPFYTRLPGTNKFLELHSVQLRTHLRPGDSGSWAYNSQGALVGFVIAGNPNSVSCLLLPVKSALQSMLSLLRRRVLAEGPALQSFLPLLSEELSAEQSFLSDMSGPWLHWGIEDKPHASRNSSPNSSSSLNHSLSIPFTAAPDFDDAMTVASSLPPPSIFSQRTSRGTPSTTTYSVTTSSHEPRHSRESLSSASRFPSTVDFTQGQINHLRRELERAWEIIQDKNKLLQKYIADKDKLLQKYIADDTNSDSDAANKDDIRFSPKDPLNEAYYEDLRQQFQLTTRFSPKDPLNEAYYEDLQQQFQLTTQLQGPSSDPQETLQPNQIRGLSLIPTASFTAGDKPLAAKKENNLVEWIRFQFSFDRGKSLEYHIRCDVESIDTDELSTDFKTENSAYPRAYRSKDQYNGDRFRYETECNAVGWALAQLNPCLRGKRKVIQQAVNCWRKRNMAPKLRESSFDEPSFQTNSAFESPQVVNPQSSTSSLRKIEDLQLDLSITRGVIEKLKGERRKEYMAKVALSQENEELRGSIKRAIEVVEPKLDGADSKGLLGLVFDLRDVLLKYDELVHISSPKKVETDTELGEPRLMDIPSYSRAEQLTPRRPGWGPQLGVPKPHEQRQSLARDTGYRPLSKKSLSVGPVGARSSIESVPELDEPESEADDVAAGIPYKTRFRKRPQPIYGHGSELKNDTSLSGPGRGHGSISAHSQPVSQEEDQITRQPK